MGRRSNGEGSIRKLPSGSWNGQIMDGSRLDGKRNIISFTAPTRGEVQRKIRDYFLAKEAGEIIVRNKGQTFEFWADLWYKDHQSQVQPSTYSGYKYTLKLLKEAKQIRLQQLRRRQHAKQDGDAHQRRDQQLQADLLCLLQQLQQGAGLFPIRGFIRSFHRRSPPVWEA